MQPPRPITPVDVSASQPRTITRRPPPHPTPGGLGEQHIGATEDQVTPTMPPKGDDDEPKQG